jgi:hypothetical protein
VDPSATTESTKRAAAVASRQSQPRPALGTADPAQFANSAPLAAAPPGHRIASTAPRAATRPAAIDETNAAITSTEPTALSRTALDTTSGPVARSNPIGPPRIIATFVSNVVRQVAAALGVALTTPADPPQPIRELLELAWVAGRRFLGLDRPQGGLGGAYGAETVTNYTGVPIQIYQYIYSGNNPKGVASAPPVGTILQPGESATIQFADIGKRVTIDFQNPPEAGYYNPVRYLWSVTFNSDGVPACSGPGAHSCTHNPAWSKFGVGDAELFRPYSGPYDSADFGRSYASFYVVNNTGKALEFTSLTGGIGDVRTYPQVSLIGFRKYLLPGETAYYEILDPDPFWPREPTATWTYTERDGSTTYQVDVRTGLGSYQSMGCRQSSGRCQSYDSRYVVLNPPTPAAAASDQLLLTAPDPIPAPVAASA